MIGLWRDYLEEEVDDRGRTVRAHVRVPEGFNFAYDVVDRIAAAEPGRRALEWCSVTGAERTLTFGDVSRLSDKAAVYLSGMGIGKGDYVLMVVKHSWQFWYLSVALHKIGAVMVPATFMLRKHDVEYRVNAARIKACICTATCDIAEQVDAAEGVPSLELKFILNGERDGWIDIEAGVEAASGEWSRVPNRSTDTMLMYFTSGTAGDPKMVLHDFAYPLGHILTAKNWYCVDPDGLHFTIADTGWIKAAWGKLYAPWMMEAGIFVYEFEKFDPSDIMDKVEEHRVTTLCSPPTMFRMFLNAGVKGHDLSSLKHTGIAGEALSPNTYQMWLEETGLKLMEAFGQTETPPIVGTWEGYEPKPGSMGVPSPLFDVDIVDPEGNPVPPGVDGEIVVRVADREPGITVGYLGNDRGNRQLQVEKVHHTGDVAWKDEDGYFWYVGRNDDLIKSSGYRISPFEIESVLMHHPAVLECAVTGVPDPVRGQLVKATIVLRQGYEGTEALAREIQAYVKRGTAPYKYPRAVEFVSELPKSTSGKIMRRAIRAGSGKGRGSDQVARQHRPEVAPLAAVPLVERLAAGGHRPAEEHGHLGAPVDRHRADLLAEALPALQPAPVHGDVEGLHRPAVHGLGRAL